MPGPGVPRKAIAYGAVIDRALGTPGITAACVRFAVHPIATPRVGVVLLKILPSARDLKEKLSFDKPALADPLGYWPVQRSFQQDRSPTANEMRAVEQLPL